MKKLLRLSLMILLVLPMANHGFIIDRVILSSNENPMYLNFWPLVSQAWSKLIGIRPTLILIDENNLPIDTTYGDVIRVNPIPGVSTASHAQVIRLLAPMYFENEICIISDIDMLPLNRDYFVNSVKNIPEDKFVVYRDRGYDPGSLRFPMCYNAGKGYLFKEIFKVKSIDDIPATIKMWVDQKCGWETDEVMLMRHVRSWNRFRSHCVFLGHTSMVPQRIDRANWGYDKKKLAKNYYIDAHMVRPLDKYHKEIQELATDLGLIF